jgi:8-oxo-dGTP diphosphatase
VEEELLATPLGLRYSGENLFQFVDGYSIHVFVFVADDVRGTPSETDEAVPLWTPLDRIPWSEMWEDDPLWLPHVFEGRGFVGRFLFDGDVMLDHDVEVLPRPPAQAPRLP